MPSRAAGAGFIAALIAIVGAALAIDRGGVLAWLGVFLGPLLLIKIYARPSAQDLGLSIGVALVWSLAWGATIYYVISTWESGEVVELGIETPNGTHTARVWILDADKSTVLIYDAEPEIAKALMSGNPVSVRRNGVVSVKIPNATPIENVPEGEVNAIFGLMEQKYGRRNFATDVFYNVLGGRRDRTVMVVKLDA